MCAGAHNIQTVVAGQVFYTLGNAGISFCKSSFGLHYVYFSLMLG